MVTAVYHMCPLIQISRCTIHEQLHTQANFRYWYCVFFYSYHISYVRCWRYQLNVNENLWDIHLTSTASPRSVSESALDFSPNVSIRHFPKERSMTSANGFYCQSELRGHDHTATLIYSGGRGVWIGQIKFWTNLSEELTLISCKIQRWHVKV